MKKKFIQDNVVCRSYHALTLPELLEKISSTVSTGTQDCKALYDGHDKLGVFWNLDIEIDSESNLWRGYLYYYDTSLAQPYD